MSDTDILIARAGRAGRITLNRPKALNALTPAMCRRIARALDDWAEDAGIALVVIDAAGERAFCAGGDLAEIYRHGRAGDFETARAFWRDEYRLNRRIFRYPKPVVALMQGFVMGGGVGIGGHARHRVVGETTRVAMPECGIGLVPDVGGSLILARAPGRLGEYIGLTGLRMEAADAIFTGFADRFVPESAWPGLIDDLERAGDPSPVAAAAQPPGPAPLAGRRAWADAVFSGATLVEILDALDRDDSETAAEAARAMARGSPLSQAVTLELIRRVRALDTIEGALELEYRATFRAISEGDFLEGVRALIIDKDRAPGWTWPEARALPPGAADDMLRPLGPDALKLEETR